MPEPNLEMNQTALQPALLLTCAHCTLSAFLPRRLRWQPGWRHLKGPQGNHNSCSLGLPPWGRISCGMCDGTVNVSFQIWKSGVTQRATTMSKGMTLFSQVSVDRLPSVSRRSCTTFLNYCYLPWADSLQSCICLEETCLYHLVLAMNILSRLSASCPSPGANK